MLGQREVSEAGGVRGVEGAMELFWAGGHLKEKVAYSVTLER